MCEEKREAKTKADRLIEAMDRLSDALSDACRSSPPFAWRIRTTFAVARLLSVPIKLRDAPYGCSHVVFEPRLTVASESIPR